MCRIANSHAGFSLLELLVVMLIIALGVGMVALAVGDGNRGLATRVEARQFANQIKMVSQEAIVGSRQWGVDLFSTLHDGEERYGYRWLQHEEGKWRAATPPEMDADHLFPARLTLVLRVDEQEQAIDQQADGVPPKELKPDLLLWSSGEMTPFELELRDRDESDAREQIHADLLGRIQLGEPTDA